VDPKKIKEIMYCPTHRNVTGVRYFMGIERYYIRFLNGFSNIDHDIS
jgi:hypothetical protein